MPKHSRQYFQGLKLHKKEEFFPSQTVHIQHKLTLFTWNIKKLYASPYFRYLALFQIGLDFKTKFCGIKTKI